MDLWEGNGETLRLAKGAAHTENRFLYSDKQITKNDSYELQHGTGTVEKPAQSRERKTSLEPADAHTR